MRIKVEQAIDPQTGELTSYVFDPETCLPVEPIQRFLNYCRNRRLASNSVKTYAYRLLDFWRYLEQAGLNWKAVNDLGDFTGWYLMGGNVVPISANTQKSTAQRSERTVNQAITAVLSLYEFHAREGRVENKRFIKMVPYRKHRGGFLQDIVKSAPEQRKTIKLKEPKKFPGCLKEEEVERLVDACTTNRDAAIILLLRWTGIRRGELLGLHLEDLVWHQRRIRIVRRNNPNEAWAKGYEREIPILDNTHQAIAALERYLNYEYPAQAERFGHGLVFVNLDERYQGRPMTADRLNKMLKGLHHKTGVKAHPHLFRHTFATRMLQAQYPDEYVQQLLGHRSIATTKDIYSHVLEEMDLHTLIIGDDNDDCSIR